MYKWLTLHFLKMNQRSWSTVSVDKAVVNTKAVALLFSSSGWLII